MVQVIVEQVNHDTKYDVISTAIIKYLRKGHLAEYDEWTEDKMSAIKHVVIITDKIELEDDLISGITDAKSSFSYVR